MIGSVELQSRKIRKRSKKGINDPQNFVCGNCNRSYKFYPGLYLHIRNKHGGIRPPGTTIIKPERKVPDIEVKSGRPIKGKSHIDELDEAHTDIETACNELMRLLGERLQIIMNLGPKNSLESVVLTVLEACQENTDKWLTDIEEESKNFLLEYQEKDLKMKNLDFEEEFMHMKRQETRKVLVWFLMWLGKVYVKSEFVPNLCVIFSRIWKVMEETQIEIQDLDNKLVWKKILQECDKQISRLPAFKNDPELLIELIKKVCQLIGKVFE